MILQYPFAAPPPLGSVSFKFGGDEIGGFFEFPKC
jgi:hypothetical protein